MSHHDDQRTWYEEFTVSGAQLLSQVKALIDEGNVRRVFIKNQDGRTLLEIPLTAGVAITAVTTVLAPALVAVGAIAALLSQVTVGVEREHSPGRSEQQTTAAGAGQQPAGTDLDQDEPPALGHA